MKSLIAIILVATSTASIAGDALRLPVLGTVDGDTIRTQIDTLPCPLCKVSIRVKGIDTPESGHLAKCDKEKELGVKAKKFLELHVGPSTHMVVTDMSWDKYGGRINGNVNVSGQDVATVMIMRGLAKPYTGKGPKPNWCL